MLPREIEYLKFHQSILSNSCLNRSPWFFYVFALSVAFRLKGSLPSELGQLTGMQMNIQLNKNSFKGRLPSELGRLTQLAQGLWLRDNSFTGYVPAGFAPV